MKIWTRYIVRYVGTYYDPTNGPHFVDRRQLFVQYIGSYSPDSDRTVRPTLQEE